jgi:hypothetical protein
MTRRLLTLLRVLSLVLLVATVAAWVRSYWAGSEFSRIGEDGYYAATVSKGSVAFNWDADPYASTTEGWEHATMRKGE